jgi:hypothetical protein
MEKPRLVEYDYERPEDKRRQNVFEKRIFPKDLSPRFHPPLPYLYGIAARSSIAIN